jgi:hypothetical protein
MLTDISKKGANIENIVEEAMKNNMLIQELIDGTLSKDDNLRFNCFNSILALCEKSPERVYQYWDFFVRLLDNENTYHKLEAVHIIACLVKFDKEGRFEKIFDKYYSLLNDKSIVTISHLAKESGRIVLAKPHLSKSITMKLLNIDSKGRENRMGLIDGYVIEGFDNYFQEADDKGLIIDFIKDKLNSDSPKTKKLAREFVKKWKIPVSPGIKDKI